MSEAFREYVEILDEAAKYFDAAPDDINRFLADMKTRQPADIPDDWWSSQLLPPMVKPGSAAAKQVVLQKVERLKAMCSQPKSEPETQTKRAEPKRKAAPLPHNSRKSLEQQFANYDWDAKK